VGAPPPARMKVRVQPPSGDVVELDADTSETILTFKCLLESLNPGLGAAHTMSLGYNGNPLLDDGTLAAAGYVEGDLLSLNGASVRPAKVDLTGAAKAAIQGRPGVAPSSGFRALRLVVSQCTNAKTNGVYLPAPPHGSKPCWVKEGRDDPDGDDPMDGDKPKSKDRGERAVFYSEKANKWWIGDELIDSGFTFVGAWGQCFMPPSRGWHNGTLLEFKGDAAEGDLDAAAALAQLDKLKEAEWAGQETCYVTLLKVLNNIASNPGEAKFCSLKIENAAIQSKILRFDGARGFLEAVGFREAAGALVLPAERHAQARLAHELLEGFANEASYENIRKERHAKAREEIKKEEATNWKRPAAPKDDAGGGPRFGQDRMRGGGG